MKDTAVSNNVEQNTDAVLLRRFELRRDEAAFAELVRRYGSLVWGVCCRRLSRREDAEDAFQATFLILAAKSSTIRSPERLGAWMHRTACRAAIRIATASPIEPLDEQQASGPDAFSEVARREAAAAIDEELIRLPTRYREPIVLFHLEGLVRSEVASRLGVTEPTVKALLTRGRSLLRSRLARRGVALPLLLPLAVEPVPAHAAVAATRLAVTFGRSGLSPFDLLGTPAKGLTPMTTWFLSKSALLGAVGAACLTLFLATRGPADAPGEGETARQTPIDTIVTDVSLAGQKSHSIAALEAPADRMANGTSASQAPAGPLISPVEARIHYALDEWTRLEFTGGVPLSDAIRFLADAHDISILLDEQRGSRAYIRDR